MLSSGSMLILCRCYCLPIFRCQLDEKMAYDTKYRELKALENQLKGTEDMVIQELGNTANILRRH